MTPDAGLPSRLDPSAEVLVAIAALLSPEDTATRREELTEVLTTMRLDDPGSRPADRFAAALGLAWCAALDRARRSVLAGTLGLVAYTLAIIQLALGLALFTAVMVSLATVSLATAVAAITGWIALWAFAWLFLDRTNPDPPLRAPTLNPGADPDVVAKFIRRLRDDIAEFIRRLRRFCFPEYLPGTEPWWRRPADPAPALPVPDPQDG